VIRPTCPRCGSADVIEIVYGLPGLDAEQAERRGEIELGGCESHDEQWACRSCRHRWP
jgi:hypothetical protein